MNIEPGDLILFAYVAEEGSFSKAAERLDTPNSTVSRRILKLESQLGERLLTRTTRKVVLTDFGRAVLRHAQQIGAEVEATIALTENRRAAPSGQLRVSMPGDFTQDMIGKLLAGFMDKYPEVSLDIDVSQRRVDIVGENFDIALRMGKLQSDATLVARPIGTFKVGLYAAPSYLSKRNAIDDPEQLMQHSVLKLQSRNGDITPWHLTRDKKTWKGVPPARAVANSPSVLLNLALFGAGIASLATHLARPHLASGALVRVLAEWECPGIPVWAVFPGRRLMPSRTRVFIDSLMARFVDFSTDDDAGT